MQKSRFNTFNDGVMFVCKEVVKESSFGAIKNASFASDFDKIVKLDFQIMSSRDEDIEFAEAHGRQLSLKVRTRTYKNVKKTHMVIICGVLYSIIRIDIDGNHELMYLYLEEVRRL